MNQTHIAGRAVPIEAGPKTVLYFCRHCKPGDPPGNYEFWTMKNETAVLVTGRRPEGRDPGERFRMMEGEPGYEAGWSAAQTVTLVRPASAKDLVRWLNDVAHAADALCAGVGEVGGQRVQVVRKADGRFHLEALS